MSHYMVAVFANRPESAEFDRLLDPFDENDKSLYIFEPVSDEELMNRWNRFKQDNPRWTYSNWLKEMWTFDEKTKSYGNSYNPHAKYDYYTLDGRSFEFEPTEDVLRKIDAGEMEYPNFFMKSQLDWFAQPEKKTERYYRKLWTKYTADGDGLMSARYYLDRYGTAEQFIKEMMRPMVPYAYLTPDGVWHSPGTVGWFAMSDETAESSDAYFKEWEEWIKHGEDCYVSLVDCHI